MAKANVSGRDGEAFETNGYFNTRNSNLVEEFDSRDVNPYALQGEENGIIRSGWTPEKVAGFLEENDFDYERDRRTLPGMVVSGGFGEGSYASGDINEYEIETENIDIKLTMGENFYEVDRQLTSSDLSDQEKALLEMTQELSGQPRTFQIVDKLSDLADRFL